MTHYEVLGVGVGATADEIRQAYRRRARDHHPDANPDDSGAGERFRQVALAYQVLSDPTSRARYDAGLQRRPDRPADTSGRPGTRAGVGDVDVAGGTSPAGRQPWPRRWSAGLPGPAPAGVADRVLQVLFVVPLLAVPGVGFLGRLVLLVVGWFAVGYLLRRHAAAVPRDWPWWRSPGWTGGGRLLRVGAVGAGLVVAGLVLRPLADSAQDAVDAQNAVEDAVTAGTEATAPAEPAAPAPEGGPGTEGPSGTEAGTAAGVEDAIDRRDEAVDELLAALWRGPVALAVVAAAWVASARLPGRFGFRDRRGRRPPPV